jgi:hypothetical protein
VCRWKSGTEDIVIDVDVDGKQDFFFRAPVVGIVLTSCAGFRGKHVDFILIKAASITSKNDA